LSTINKSATITKAKKFRELNKAKDYGVAFNFLLEEFSPSFERILDPPLSSSNIYGAWSWRKSMREGFSITQVVFSPHSVENKIIPTMLKIPC
jgi:hypothetical protein